MLLYQRQPPQRNCQIVKFPLCIIFIAAPKKGQRQAKALRLIARHSNIPIAGGPKEALLRMEINKTTTF